MADVEGGSVMLKWFGCRYRSTLAMILSVMVSIVVGFISVSASAKEQLKTEVADLRYGVALYNYYQQDYLSALAELMVADARDGIQGHGDNPELIAGGISLAFGMQNHAEAVFTRILQDNRRPQSVRDAAWFYLGKLYYTRGEWAAAERSFVNISPEFKPATRAQQLALQTNIRIRNNNFSDISLKKINAKELRDWNPYVLYNLGAANARAGQFKTGLEFFNELAAINVLDNSWRREEQWNLQDKAFTAIGYTYLAEKKYKAAIRKFTRVRLNGIYSNQAMLGYGWAAAAQKKYAEALKPWQLLTKRSLISPSVQESLLALPFAYEKLNAQGEALNAYQMAEALLEREIELVTEMRQTLTEEELLILIGGQSLSIAEAKKTLQENSGEQGTLSAVITDDGQNWLKLDKTSVIKTRSGHLNELFAKSEFQTAVLDLRDLLRVQKLLQNWLPKIDAYRELLFEKQASRDQLEKQAANDALGKKQRQLQQERDELAAKLNRIIEVDDYMALAGEEIREPYKRILRGQKTIERMKADGQNTSDVETRLKLFNGILMWRAAQEYQGNLAERQAALAETDKALMQIAQTKLRIEEVLITSIDIQPLLARLDVSRKDLIANLNTTETIIEVQSMALRNQVDAALALHEKRLKKYLAHAHLAVARLYDTELRKQPQ